MPALKESCRKSLGAAGLEVVIVERFVDLVPVVQICDRIPRISGSAHPREGQIRLVAGCTNLDGSLWPHAILVGVDAGVHPNWQVCGFLSSPSYSLVRASLYRLLLDPLFTGVLAEGSPVGDERDLGRVHAQIIRNRVAQGLPRAHGIEPGRILWVDLNPTVDTIVDSYGLCILNQIATDHGFLGFVVSPFLEFERPEDSIKEIVTRFGPNLIGLSLRNLDDAVSIRNVDGPLEGIDTLGYLETAQRLVAAIRSAFCGPMVLGGAALTRSPRILMEALDVEFGVQGPGDVVIDSLLLKWRPGCDGRASLVVFRSMWKDIPGALSRGEGSGSSEPPVFASSEAAGATTKVLRNPVKLWFERRNGIATAVRGSYGCPLDCTYCLEATPRVRVRQRGADAVVDEMQWLLSEYGIRHFHLTDSEANLPFSRLQALASVIRGRRLHDRVTWTVYATPAPFDTSALEELCVAGLRCIKLSIDHFAPAQLRSLGKVHSEQSIHRLLEALREAPAALSVSASILFGAPGETLSTINYAAEKIREYSDSRVLFYYNVGLRLYPGTPLFKDWWEGRLDATLCHGPGCADGGLSPLIYCAPAPPRVLCRKIEDDLAACPNARLIAASRSAASDESLRLLHVAAGAWFRGDTGAAVAALKTLGFAEGVRGGLAQAAFRQLRHLRGGANVAVHESVCELKRPN
jgi:radical SAM superfamily enzyme YgiQ (UPF0313 family)